MRIITRSQTDQDDYAVVVWSIREQSDKLLHQVDQADSESSLKDEQVNDIVQQLLNTFKTFRIGSRHDRSLTACVVGVYELIGLNSRSWVTMAEPTSPACRRAASGAHT